MKYILASASPRRKELLAKTGIEYTVIPSDVEEVITKNEPCEVVMELASLKASDVFDKHGDEDTMVIGSDTIVVYKDEILGKPEDKDDARDMLSMLSDRTHQVYTGIALISLTNGKKNVKTFYECTDVTFYPITREDIDKYVESGDPLDKAGSYGIQTDFAIHIKEIKGDYNNVVGLPVGRLYQELKDTIEPVCKKIVFE